MAALSSVAGGAILVSLAVLTLVVVAAVAGALRRGGRREDPMDPHDALAVSRFTIPVSLIVPAGTDGAPLSSSIRSLLALSYPELEVIVVAAGMPRTEFDALKEAWTLEPKEFFYRRSVATGPVRRIYSSGRDPRLIVVEKPDPGCADALNSGLCLARFRYIASIAPTVVFDGDALLRMMSPALRDPASVLAVVSHVETRGAGVVGAWQRIDSIRSWMLTRLTGDRLRCGLAPRHAVVVWRRDAVLDMGGFSTSARDAELDMLQRLETSTRQLSSGRVLQNADIVGRVDPVTLNVAARAAGGAERAVVLALSALRQLARGPVSRGRMRCFFLAELLAPAIQACVLVTVVTGAVAGWFPWTSVALAVLLLAFGNATITAAALLLRGASTEAPSSTELSRLLLLAPAEYVIYRPAVALSRVARLLTRAR